MKIKTLEIMLLLILIIGTFAHPAYADEPQNANDQTNNSAAVLNLPTSLTVIENEAFANCGAKTVVLPVSCVRIGEYAFANNANLTSISIPGGTTEIADTAFSNCPRLTISCEYGSVAHRYAEKQHIPFALSGKIYVELSETNFPDSVFRAFAADNYDSDKDGYLSEEEIKAIKNIDCSSMGIASLCGIEYFSELNNLICWHNDLTSVDLSNNRKLTTFRFNGRGRIMV